MVFHWSLSDSKSRQVSRTLLSILADLNNGVVWMVLSRPTSLWEPFQVHQLRLVLSSPSCSIAFLASPSICVSFWFVWFSFCGPLEWQNSRFSRISFYYYSFESFSRQCHLKVFHWIWSDIKSLQVSRIPLSILTDLNDMVALMVSICPLIFKSPSPFTNPQRIIPSAPIVIGITVTFKFHNFF